MAILYNRPNNCCQENLISPCFPWVCFHERATITVKISGVFKEAGSGECSGSLPEIIPIDKVFGA